MAEICDFCSDRSPRWRFPCRNFGVTITLPRKAISISDWLACDPCAELIERHDWDGLAERSLLSPGVRFAINTGTISRKQMLDGARDLHRQFRENMTGEKFSIVQ